MLFTIFIAVLITMAGFVISSARDELVAIQIQEIANSGSHAGVLTLAKKSAGTSGDVWKNSKLAALGIVKSSAIAGTSVPLDSIVAANVQPTSYDDPGYDDTTFSDPEGSIQVTIERGQYSQKDDGTFGFNSFEDLVAADLSHAAQFANAVRVSITRQEQHSILGSFLGGGQTTITRQSVATSDATAPMGRCAVPFAIAACDLFRDVNKNAAGLPEPRLGTVPGSLCDRELFISDAVRWPSFETGHVRAILHNQPVLVNDLQTSVGPLRYPNSLFLPKPPIWGFYGMARDRNSNSLPQADLGPAIVEIINGNMGGVTSLYPNNCAVVKIGQAFDALPGSTYGNGDWHTMFQGTTLRIPDPYANDPDKNGTALAARLKDALATKIEASNVRISDLNLPDGGPLLSTMPWPLGYIEFSSANYLRRFLNDPTVSYSAPYGGYSYPSYTSMELEWPNPTLTDDNGNPVPFTRDGWTYMWIGGQGAAGNPQRMTNPLCHTPHGGQDEITDLSKVWQVWIPVVAARDGSSLCDWEAPIASDPPVPMIVVGFVQANIFDYNFDRLTDRLGPAETNIYNSIHPPISIAFSRQIDDINPVAIPDDPMRNITPSGLAALGLSDTALPDNSPQINARNYMVDWINNTFGPAAEANGMAVEGLYSYPHFSRSIMTGMGGQPPYYNPAPYYHFANWICANGWPLENTSPENLHCLPYYSVLRNGGNFDYWNGIGGIDPTFPGHGCRGVRARVSCSAEMSLSTGLSTNQEVVEFVK